MATLRTALALVLVSWTGLADGAQDSVTRRLDRLDRLQQWLEAVEQHEFGTADDPLMRVASWDRNTLWLVWQDVSSIVSLVREPDVLIFYTPIEPEPLSGIFRLPSNRRPSRVIPYGRNEITRLKLIAQQVVNGGGENRILKRGATLHAEIATLGPPTPSPDPARQPRSDSVMLFLADGQQTGDKVRPKDSRKLGSDPGADETVRLWYLASNVYMQSVEQVDAWHVDRSVQLFPQDPEILFVAGCAREMFSGPQIQSVLLSTTLSRGLFNLYGDEGEELRRAEKYYRESLERDPSRAEARIRLGRVLNRRGRHQDAIVELRRATTATKNRLLLYYGNLFSGDAADALGLAEEARTAYRRAGELFELAQSPQLALSSMAARAGDRSGALAAIEEVLSRDQPVRADDPWWGYYTAQTRDLEGVWTALRVVVTAERAPQ
jgi:Tetratricopeptide repeat